MTRQKHLKLIFKLRTLCAVYKTPNYYDKNSLWYKYDDIHARAINLYIRKYGWNKAL